MSFSPLFLPLLELNKTMCFFFTSKPISSPLSKRAFDQGQAGASYLFSSPVEPGRQRGPAAVLLMIKSLERAGGQLPELRSQKAALPHFIQIIVQNKS